MISRRANLASHILGGGTILGAADWGSFDVITRQYIREWIFMPAFVSILLVTAGSTAQHREQKLTKPAKVPPLLPNCCQIVGWPHMPLIIPPTMRDVGRQPNIM